MLTDALASVAVRHRSGAVGPVADGLHPGVPHHPGAAGGVVVGDDPDRQLPRHQARRPRRDAAGAALVEVHGGHLRRRGRDRHRALLRVRPAVAQVHGPVGRGVRGPVRLRGHLLLHRGGLHLDLHLRLAPAEAVGPLLDRGADRDRRHLRQHLGGGGQRLDELPSGRHPRLGRQRDRRRPHGRHLQRRHAADGRPHGGRGVPRRRLHDRVRLRRRDAPGPHRPLPPDGLHHRLHRRGDRDPGADGRGRRAGALGLRQPAHQVRGDRDGAQDQQRRARGASRPSQLQG